MAKVQLDITVDVNRQTRQGMPSNLYPASYTKRNFTQQHSSDLMHPSMQSAYISSCRAALTCMHWLSLAGPLSCALVPG